MWGGPRQNIRGHKETEPNHLYLLKRKSQECGRRKTSRGAKGHREATSPTSREGPRGGAHWEPQATPTREPGSPFTVAWCL